MRICPACHSNGVYASHRRGLLERSLLTWIGIFPYRCGQCQTRYYRPTGRAFRRPAAVNALLSPYPIRSARWPVRVPADVILRPPQDPEMRITGSTENVSLQGMQIRLPAVLKVDDQVGIRLGGEDPRVGQIRWVRPQGGLGGVYGVRFQAAAGRRTYVARPFRRLLWRQRLQRFGQVLLGLALMAGAAYGLVWMLEALRIYNPTYYEPKDIERQLFEQQQNVRGSPQSSR